MPYSLKSRKGFTLVEILVVLALTIVILGLVFGPVISSFNFTRKAQTMVRAQDNARFALEQISRELADAMFVYDNTNQPIDFPMEDASGSVVPVKVLYAKVDIVLPRMMGFCVNPGHPAGARKEYPRHEPLYPQLDEAAPNCPECGAPLELRPAQPLAQDKFIVRYFIGLADPSQPYRNGFTHRFSEGADNTYVLYRVEFSPYDQTLFDNPDAAHFADNLRDPGFFYGAHAAQWKRISRAIVTLEHTDLIVQEFDDRGKPIFDAQGMPIVTPTVKFTPTAIYNDPLVPTTESDDDPEHGDSLPTVFKATYGQWTTPIEVTLSRAGQSYRAVQAAANLGDPPLSCVLYDPNNDPLLDITHYLETRSASPYRVGEVLPAGRPEVAFTINTAKGAVDFAFPVVDITASNSLSAAVGKMAVSKTVSTDDVNNAYIPGGAGVDRYRKLVLNEPGFAPTPIANATVVAGSERVVAPDAAPGANRGNPFRYSRVPGYLYEPGLNQYQLDIDYNDGNANSPPGLACLFFHSYQTNQPGSGVALPSGTNNLHVYYEVQNNKKGDTLRANYVTKSLLTVIMGIRIFDPTSGKPQSVQLTNKVKLRNIAE